MVPMVHSGCGLNFGLPLGIVSGLLGATLSIELGYTGFASFLMAILIATPFALLFGGGYGWLLNKIKGGEMMIATYVGFSSVSFMCMMCQHSDHRPEQHRHQSGDPHRYAAVLRADGRADVGVPAHQDRHRHDRCGLQPRLCPRSGHQRGQDAAYLRDHVHLAGCCGYSGV